MRCYDDNMERETRTTAGRAGFVLTGGRSSRMGTDKALLRYQGVTLVEAVARVVREAAGAVTLVGSRERYARFGIPVVEDRLPGCGPLAGIEAALSATQAEWNLIVACDMPALTREFLNVLLDRAERSQAACLVPASPDGRPQPLCSVWHRGCAEPVREALDGGARRISDVLAIVGAEIWPAAGESWFLNVNTPDEWDVCRHV